MSSWSEGMKGRESGGKRSRGRGWEWLVRRVQGRKTRGRVGRRYGHGRRQRQRTAGVGVDVGRTARPGKSPFADRDCPDQCIQIHSQSEPSTKHSASPFFLSRNTLSFQWIHSDVIPIVASPSQTPAPAASARASFPRAYLHRWAAAQDSRNSSFCLTTASPSSLCQFHASITSTAPAARSHVSPEHVSLEPAEHEPRSHHT